MSVDIITQNRAIWQMVGIQLMYTEWNCMFLLKMGW